jgi:hypothetical protein
VEITFALARNAPVGVVIASHSSRHSRIYRWDLETDVFTAGQFVKARAHVEDISADGRYVAYFATALHHLEQGYIAVAHIPYFTALALFPAHHILRNHARFLEDGRLSVEANPLGWSREHPRIVRERMEPGCPFAIVRQENPPGLATRDRGVDQARNRLLTVEDALLVATDLKTKARSIIKGFTRDPFEAVATPDWAKTW